MRNSIIYFPHGATSDNDNDVATGWRPGTLSPTGTRQMRELRNLLGGAKYDAVFSSDLGRAVASAALCFGDRQVIRQDERLRECDFGDLTGTSATSLARRACDFVETPFPNGESYLDVERRVRYFVEELRANFKGAKIAVVSHQAPQLALEVVSAGKNWKEAIRDDWRNTGSWQPGWTYFI